jgi:hypothetical protein
VSMLMLTLMLTLVLALALTATETLVQHPRCQLSTSLPLSNMHLLMT